MVALFNENLISTEVIGCCNGSNVKAGDGNDVWKDNLISYIGLNEKRMEIDDFFPAMITILTLF